jgi:menaquinone-dependent protoporphyrinogen oxidase
MSTLIVYATRYGFAEKCANMLAEKLTEKVDLCDLKKNKKANPADYDTVIVGGSMYMGRIMKQVPAFLQKHADTLKQKRTGFFLSAMAEGEDLNKELEASFPEEMRAGAVAVECFGGECIINNLNSFHKFIFTKVAKTENDLSNINAEAIDRFVEAVNQD